MELEKIKITYTCPETSYEVTSDDFELTGYSNYNEYEGSSSSGVEIIIHKCKDCGKYHKYEEIKY